MEEAVFGEEVKNKVNKVGEVVREIRGYQGEEMKNKVFYNTGKPDLVQSYLERFFMYCLFLKEITKLTEGKHIVFPSPLRVLRGLGETYPLTQP